MGAVSVGRCGGRGGRPGRRLPEGSAGVRPVGGDAAVVWHGSAAMVPVLLGGRAGVGSGDPGRGRRVLPLAADRGKAGWPALAGPARRRGRRGCRGCGRGRAAGWSSGCRREAGAWPQVRGGHGGALRDGAASFLRVSPCIRVRADGEPVPAGPRPGRAGRRASQPDGAASAAPVGAVPAAGRAACPAQHPRCAVQRVVCAAVLAPGPGAGRVLGLDRGACLGVAGRHCR